MATLGSWQAAGQQAKLKPVMLAGDRVSRADLVCVITPVAELLEDAGDGTRDHTPVNIALSTSSDSEGLARPCLTICKHCAIVSFQCADHNWLRHPLKHLQRAGSSDSCSNNGTTRRKHEAVDVLPHLALHLV
jgi:hypothetical protein